MCAGSDMMHGPEMATCCAMCSNMVEMAQATMHMMMRPAGMNMDVMSAMMTACLTMGKACLSSNEGRQRSGREPTRGRHPLSQSAS